MDPERGARCRQEKQLWLAGAPLLRTRVRARAGRVGRRAPGRRFPSPRVSQNPRLEGGITEHKNAVDGCFFHLIYDMSIKLV